MRAPSPNPIGRSVARWALAGLLVMGCGVSLALGAEELTVSTAPPVVIRTVPEAGQADIDPALKEIRATFSKPMRDGSWSWVQISPGSFPKLAGQPSFQADERTAVLPVALDPGRTYAIWLNSPSHENFQDSEGRKAVPYLLVFSTRK